MLVFDGGGGGGDVAEANALPRFELMGRLGERQSRQAATALLEGMVGTAKLV